MRNTTISSSIASVVSRVIKSVVGAGAVRNFLNLAQMRERMGYWLGLCQLRFALVDGDLRHSLCKQAKPGLPGGKRHSWHTDIAQAVYAPSRLTSARAQQLRPTQAG